MISSITIYNESAVLGLADVTDGIEGLRILNLNRDLVALL
jgi:hypothetical protein